MVEPKCQVNAWVSPETMGRINKLKDEHNISRREIIERGIDALEQENNMGAAGND